MPILSPQITTTPEADVAATTSAYIIARGERPTLLMIAGGSLPETVLPQMSRGIFSSALTICIFDERCTADLSGQNEAMLQATPFYGAAQAAGVAVLPVGVGQASDCTAVAAAWEEQLRRWRSEHEGGEIVVLAGVGADGHIAGILCHETSETPYFTDERWIVTHTFTATDNPYPSRITPSFTFWQTAVAATFIYMSGEEKADALTAIMAEQGTYHDTPGRVLRDLESVMLLTDTVV